MGRHFREGDVVCRFGGEEFTVIAPRTAADLLSERVEIVRKSIEDLDVHHTGRRLGATSMSFGIAEWDGNISGASAPLMQAADDALYRAKREGRNRMITSLPRPVGRIQTTSRD